MATMVTPVSINSTTTERKIDGLELRNRGIFMITKFVVYHSGILFLECYNYQANFDERIGLIAGCFEDGSNMEEVLRDYKLLDTFEKLDGIVMTVGRIPILATCGNHDSKKLYEEWERQMESI